MLIVVSAQYWVKNGFINNNNNNNNTVNISIQIKWVFNKYWIMNM